MEPPNAAAPKAAEKDQYPAFKREINLEQKTETKGEVTIKGQKVPYKVTATTQPVWDEDGKAIAALFYVYYERTDVTNKETRPLVISFNGGPGTASVWMHLGYTGPKKLKIDDEGYPVQPYGFEDNPQSLIDVADIVFIDPVNTGFSRILDKSVPTSKFFGVNADIKYLADWINAFVARQKRWASPKFLIGESYGTTRVSGLSLELQNRHWMYLNGVILVSPTDLGIDRDRVSDAALRIPYMAATAWHHKKLATEFQSKDLTKFLPEVESFTINELMPAIAQGGALSMEKRKDMVKKVSKYIGLNETVVAQQSLEIPYNYFWKELLRDQGKTIGRVGAALQFALVPHAFEDAQGRAFCRRQVRIGLAWQLNAEPLASQGLTILQAGITDRAHRHTGGAGQALGGFLGVQLSLFDPQPQVLTGALQGDIQHFVDLEVFGNRLQHRTTEVRTVGARTEQFEFVHALTSKATACTAMPSSRPVNPSFSVVVALTLT